MINSCCHILKKRQKQKTAHGSNHTGLICLHPPPATLASLKTILISMTTVVQVVKRDVTIRLTEHQLYQIRSNKFTPGADHGLVGLAFAHIRLRYITRRGDRFRLCSTLIANPSTRRHHGPIQVRRSAIPFPQFSFEETKQRGSEDTGVP